MQIVKRVGGVLNVLLRARQLETWRLGLRNGRRRRRPAGASRIMEVLCGDASRGAR